MGKATQNQQGETQPEFQSLREKLISVYNAVAFIEKKGHNKTLGYDYVRAADISDAIRKTLATVRVYAEVNFETLRVYVIPREKKSDIQGVDVRATIVFRDADSDEVLTTSALGSGTDSLDKAVYKAQTGALKYALRQAFLVPDEEADPENDEREVRGAYDDDDDDEAPRHDRRPQYEDDPESAPRPTRRANARAERSTIEDSRPNTKSAPSTEDSTPADEDVNTGKKSNPDDLPTAEEIKVYRERFDKLVSKLADNGLTASKGKPITRKVVTYLLATTGEPDTDHITNGQWEKFFNDALDVAQQDNDGFKNLVELVNKSNEEKKR